MKIAILSCFYPYRGGISQFNACLYGELGRENDVRAFNFKRQYPDILFPGKTQYVTEDDEAVPVESVSLLDTANPFSFGRTLKAMSGFGPDLVIVRYWMSWFAPSLGWITRMIHKKVAGVKVVSILDNVIPHEPHFFDAPLTRYFLKGSDGCVTLCNAVRDDLAALDPSKRTITLNHPLYSHFGERMDREEACRKFGLDPSKKTLLFFGLIRKYKGLDILLEAFRGLSDEYQLLIAGEPYGSFDEYAEIIGSLPGRGRIRTDLRYIKDSEVSAYFSAADLAVLPYRSATQSGISAVAYHFDLPMVVTSVGGLRETIGESGTGLAVDSPEPALVREAIERYFSDPEIAAACRRSIASEKERLSWRAFCERLLAFAGTL
ncbi:MAG: glycosyltransferase [Bacteroidales bacterium]|nr:glycosyltransferase [Bacteroidales bacterium]